MSKEDIIKLAMELGTSIANSQEFRDLKTFQDNLNQDEQALGLVMKYQDARMNLETKKREGQLIGPGDENHLNILEQQMQSNDLLQNIMNSQDRFNSLMQAVYFAMNQSISGGCSPGNCGGSCSGCGA